MSDFGVFELVASHEGDDEAARLSRSRKFLEAQYDVSQRFGSFLMNASSRYEFDQRVALVRREINQIVSQYARPTDTLVKRLLSKLEQKVRQSSEIDETGNTYGRPPTDEDDDGTDGLDRDQDVELKHLAERESDDDFWARMERGEGKEQVQKSKEKKRQTRERADQLLTKGKPSYQDEDGVIWVSPDNTGGSWVRASSKTTGMKRKSDLHSNGWNYDPESRSYKSSRTSTFNCPCGSSLKGVGQHRCKCGSVWNISSITRSDKTASQPLFVAREVDSRDHAILARLAKSRKGGNPAPFVRKKSGLSRKDALDQIDAIRETLNPDTDYNHRALVGIIRDLWDNYPIDDAKSNLSGLQLNDYNAEQKIRSIVNSIDDDDASRDDDDGYYSKKKTATFDWSQVGDRDLEANWKSMMAIVHDPTQAKLLEDPEYQANVQQLYAEIQRRGLGLPEDQQMALQYHQQMGLQNAQQGMGGGADPAPQQQMMGRRKKVGDSPFCWNCGTGIHNDGQGGCRNCGGEMGNMVDPHSPNLKPSEEETRNWGKQQSDRGTRSRPVNNEGGTGSDSASSDSYRPRGNDGRAPYSWMGKTKKATNPADDIYNQLKKQPGFDSHPQNIDNMYATGPATHLDTGQTHYLNGPSTMLQDLGDGHHHISYGPEDQEYTIPTEQLHSLSSRSAQLKKAIADEQTSMSNPPTTLDNMDPLGEMKSTAPSADPTPVTPPTPPATSDDFGDDPMSRDAEYERGWDYAEGGRSRPRNASRDFLEGYTAGLEHVLSDSYSERETEYDGSEPNAKGLPNGVDYVEKNTDYEDPTPSFREDFAEQVDNDNSGKSKKVMPGPDVIEDMDK